MHRATEIALVAFIPQGQGNEFETNFIEYEITFDACTLNTFTVDPEIEDFEYEIKSGPVTKIGGFVPSLSDCTIPTFVLEQKDWNGPGDFNEDFFTFSSTIPEVKVEINLEEAQGEYTLILKAISDDGNELARDEFTVSANP